MKKPQCVGSVGCYTLGLGLTPLRLISDKTIRKNIEVNITWSGFGSQVGY